MDKKVCRMCGKSRNSSNLLDLSSEITFQIEFHCRISLEDNKLLPQNICFDCNYAVTNFATFSDNAKEIQIRLMMENNLDQVKLEIHELPVVECFIQDNVKQSYRVQPAKKKRKLRSNESSEDLYNESEDPALVDEEMNSTNSESEWNNASNSSDSDYQTSSYKKKKKENTKPVKSRRGRKPAVQKKEETEAVKNAVELDIAECDKNDDGTITTSADLCFNGEKWCDMRLSCQECDQVVKGPFELREHYTKQHSSDLSGYEKYQCPECVDTDENVVQYFHKFLNHYIDHQPYLKFCCLICSEMFWNLDSLQQHYQSNHDQNSLFNCLLCGRFFKTDFYLTSHETRVHKVHINREDGEIRIPNQAAITVESLFADELASDLFERENIFKLPTNEKNADGSVTAECRNRFTGRTWTSLPLSCLKCDIRQQTAFDLYEHYNNQHSNSKERNFVCSNCPEQKTFFNLESFINHTFTIHHEHLRYFCFICNEICWNYKALYQHFKSEHIEYKANICLYCGKYHKSGYDLKCHSEVHISLKKDEVGTFKCNLCPKSYSRKLQLQRHLDVHKNERSWICETCGTSFKSKSSLINHYMVHQTEKPFICETCGEGFKNKYKLKHHKGIHTGERKFSCEICGQRFRAKGTLKGHFLTHTGERPFKCEFCDKAFAAKYDLMVHTRLHTGEFTHECKICGERYPSWSNYSKHMRGRHQVDPRSEKKKKYDALHKSIPMDTKDGSSASNSMDGSSQYLN